MVKISQRAIDAYIKKIGNRFHPKKIILFGSYAHGKPTKGSDVDLLVIMDTKLRPIEQEVVIKKEVPAPFPVDLIVRSPKELMARIKEGDFFLKMILQKGKNYENDYKGMD